MKPRALTPLLTLVILFASNASHAAADWVIAPANTTGVYKPDDTIEWKIELHGAPGITEATYILKKGGLTVIKEGKLELHSGAATLTTNLNEPGTILAEIKTKVDGKEVKGLGGAVVSPDQIQPSSACPDDFDAFWKAKLEELAAVPANPQLEAADAGKDGIEYFKLCMDNIRGSHIYGQLAKPKGDGKFPALLLVQYAGVYGLPKTNVTNRAAQGWMSLNIMAHDLPFDRDEAFYKKASDTTLKNYTSMGSEDREKTYFLRMYLSCYRAADYLATRSDWDGRTLVVMGTSQGGQQSFVTAGIHPRITAMLANVPAGCDSTGPLIGRAAGFPYWMAQGKWAGHEKQSTETGRYYDAVNFAARIKCPAMVSMGLIDETCPPAGVLAAVNQIKGEHVAIILPLSNHHGTHNAQAEFYSKSEQWLRKLVKGETALPK